MSFVDRSLKVRLMLIIGLAVGTGLVFNTLLFAVWEIDDSRTVEIDKLAVMAELLAASSAPAIAMDDRDSASASLAGLRARPEILAGSITLPDGRAFAAYPPNSLPLPATGHEYGRAVFRGGDGNDTLQIDYPIRQGDELIGTLSLRSSLRPMWTKAGPRLLFIVASTLLAFGAALLLAVRLQRSISAPIMELTTVIRRIVADSDYSRRLPVDRGDEVGELITGFNNLLHEVAQRDQQLRAHQATLAEQVNLHTAQLQAVTRTQLAAILARHLHPASRPAASEPAASSEPPTVRVFDPQVVQRLPMVADGSNPEFADRVLQMFTDSTDTLLAEFAAASDRQDKATMQRTAHTLKSSAATVGALELAEQACEIEMALRAGTPPAAGWPDEIASGYQRFRKALLQHRTETTAEKESRP